MELQHYFNLYNYLVNKEHPENFSSQQKRQLEKQAKNFRTKNNFLYKTDRNNPTKLLRVIQKEELPALLYMMHNDPTAGHFAVEAMVNKIKTRYYWPQYYEDIRKYVAACDACQKRGRNKKNNVLHLYLCIVLSIK